MVAAPAGVGGRGGAGDGIGGVGGRATRWMQGCGGLEKRKGERPERVRLIETRRIQ